MKAMFMGRSYVSFRKLYPETRIDAIFLVFLTILPGGCIETPIDYVPAATPSITLSTTPSAASAGTVTRIFSSSTIQPGSNFTITLTPSPSKLFDSPGYQVTETIPAGFNLTANTAGLATKAGNIWTFTNMGSASITYNLTAPESAGSYTFRGTFKDQDRAVGKVGGSSILLVGSSTGTVIPTSTVTEAAIKPGEMPFNTSDFIK